MSQVRGDEVLGEPPVQSISPLRESGPTQHDDENYQTPPTRITESYVFATAEVTQGDTLLVLSQNGKNVTVEAMENSGAGELVAVQIDPVMAIPRRDTRAPLVPTHYHTVDWSETPMEIYCRHCHNYVITAITKEQGFANYGCCVVLCCVGCVYGCCLIPFCVEDLKDTIHRCPVCQETLGHSGPSTWVIE